METEDDLGIRVWVGNLGKYVEGELKGSWASLPMPQRELNRFLRDTVGLGPEAAEARATGRVYEEYAIHDYEYDGLLEALDYRSDEYENLDDLNLLARAAQVFERESPGMIERVRMAADTLVQSTPLSLANLIAQCDDIDWCEYDPPAGIDPANIDDLDELYAWHCVERDPDLARVMQGRWGMYMDMAWLGRDSALCDDVTLGEHGFLLANGVPDASRYDRGELRELLDALDPPAPAPDFRLEDLLEEGEHIERYAIEGTGTNWGAPEYDCIMPDGSTDLAAGLEDTVQRIIADRHEHGDATEQIRLTVGAVPAIDLAGEEGIVPIDRGYALPGPIITADQARQPAKGKGKGEALEGIRRRAGQRSDMKGTEAATKTRGGHAR